MRLTTAIAGIPLALVLLGLSCPTPEQPLPPPLGSPAIDSMALTWFNDRGTFQPALLVRWKAPKNDSVSIASFVVLRKRFPLDNGFSANLRGIPADTTTVRISIADVPTQTTDSVLYCVYAVDSLGRPSDTSRTRTLRLTGPALLEYPANGAQLDSPYFTWSVGYHGYAAGFFSYMAITNDNGYLWQSPRPVSPIIVGENDTFPFKVQAPDSLSAGTYQWIVLVNDYYPDSTTVMGSIVIREFHAP